MKDIKDFQERYNLYEDCSDEINIGYMRVKLIIL